MMHAEWRSSPPSRPVASRQPYELSAHLRSFGVRFRIVGSAASGQPARDLDLLIVQSPANLARLEAALSHRHPVPQRVARTLRRLCRDDVAFPLTITTSMGPLDIHGWDQ